MICILVFANSLALMVILGIVDFPLVDALGSVRVALSAGLVNRKYTLEQVP